MTSRATILDNQDASLVWFAKPDAGGDYKFCPIPVMKTHTAVYAIMVNGNGKSGVGVRERLFPDTGGHPPKQLPKGFDIIPTLFATCTLAWGGVEPVKHEVLLARLHETIMAAYVVAVDAERSTADVVRMSGSATGFALHKGVPWLDLLRIGGTPETFKFPGLLKIAEKGARKRPLPISAGRPCKRKR
jgi:hypothetical protein